MSRLFRKGKSSSSQPQAYPQQQPRVVGGRLSAAGGKQRSGAKNPQSGASYSSSSRGTGGTQHSDDGAAVHINLTDQRLNDWRNDGPTSNTAAAAGTSNAAGRNVSFPNNHAHPQRKPTSKPPSSGVTNLILLIEQSKWTEASQRAQTHPHEVKQLVKLRKTTKSTSGISSSVGGVQISNVKCKALHHACQKLRSVHTNIYSNRACEAKAEGIEGGQAIDDDEYIEACKCILTLIRLHPEACKERESRHGCLPLHLAVFSMCPTPPPPGPSGKYGMNGATMEQSMDDKTHSRVNSDSTYNLTFSQRPPPTASRGSSVPKNPPVPQAHKGHRATNSNSSADFSIGQISTMIQEETEHQHALDQHQQSVKAAKNDDNNVDDTSEGKLLSRINDMEMILKDLEEQYNGAKAKKNRRGKSGGAVSPTAVGMCSSESDIPGSAVLSTVEGSTGATQTTTKVVGLSLPMDSLDEMSRETDSHSSPLDDIAPLWKQMAPPADEKPASYTSSSFTAQVGNLGKSISSKFNNVKTATQSSAATVSTNNSVTPSQNDEFRKRFLQINTTLREEYSIRVINALLDAWPRGIKTSSEGGRLPLHMACFGKATVKVMEQILSSYPDAARQRNADGFLPIHIAAHWGVSHPDIAPLLLRAYPDGAVGRNRWERTPIEEALGMAGENGRDHQMALVWSLRRHPTYWIHNDIASMLLPRNVKTAPWRLVDAGVSLAGNPPVPTNTGIRMIHSGAVDVDEVGSSDDDNEGFEVQGPNSQPYPSPVVNNKKLNAALAESTNLSILVTREKNWAAATLRCQHHPHEAREILEVKVRGAYTAKITPLHYACEQNPSVELIRALVNADPSALRRRQEPGGQLPLHAACTWGASIDVIKLLLSACPDSAEACDFLSNLPLHCACYAGADTLVAKALLRIYPQSVWPRNHQGSSALDIARRLGHPNRKEIVGLLEDTMNALLTTKLAQGDASTSKADEGVETSGDNGLMWV